MSLCLIITTGNGLVLAGDSRASYINKSKFIKVGSDNAYKVFQLNKCCGMVVTGTGSLVYNKHLRSIEWLVDKLLNEKRSSLLKTTIKDVVNITANFFSKIIQDNIKNEKILITSQLEKTGCTNICFNSVNNYNIFDLSYKNKKGENKIERNIIAINLELMFCGYDYASENNECHRVNFLYYKPNHNIYKNECSIHYSGQTSYVNRILHGYDTNQLLPLIQRLKTEDGKSFQLHLQKMLIDIKFNLMPLQDAIELARLLIETTSAIQKFSDGFKGYQGSGIHGVGGAVDTAIIKPFEGFSWVSKKKFSS